MKKRTKNTKLERLLSVCMFVYFFKERIKEGQRGGECRDGEQLGIGHLLESIS